MSERPVVLVTGAGGYVGRQVVEEALRHGAQVKALVRRPRQARALEPLGVQPVLGDLRDAGALEKALAGVHGVYHIAALFRQAGAPDSEYEAVNVEGVRLLFEAALRAGVQRIVHCSTVGVLGDVRDIPANETTPFNPGDIYQRTKLAGECVALEYLRSGKIGGLVIRPAMIYGPGDTRNLKLFRMIAKGVFFYVGRGDNLVHYVDVRDLARAFRLAMEREDCNGGVYIIAGQRYMPLKEFTGLVARELGRPAPWLRLPVRPMQGLGSLCEALCKPLGVSPPLYRRRVDFYTKNRAFDFSQARKDLGYEPVQTPEQEIADIIMDYRERQWLA